MSGSLPQAAQTSPLTTEPERLFAKSVPIFINVRDRLEPLAKLLEWLRKAGHHNIVLINVASTYPPLLRFLGSCPYRVVNLKRNLGPFALWLLPEFRKVVREQWFVYTDSDVVPAEDCPLDAVAYLHRLLQQFPLHLKAGLGLRLDDLPDCYRQKQKVIEWESGLYGRELMPGVFQADVDTTFALYRPHAPRTCPAIRTRGLYEARHTPWYADSANPDEEEVYYHSHAWPVARHWRLNGSNGGRPSAPSVPGGIACQIESDPQSLLSTILRSKLGRLVLACYSVRHLSGKQARLWRASHASADEARQAVLEIMKSDDWQTVVNLRTRIDLLLSAAAFRMARIADWMRHLLSPSGKVREAGVATPDKGSSALGVARHASRR